MFSDSISELFFLASIYSCEIKTSYRKTKLTSNIDSLPKNIKNPLIELSDKLYATPCLQYAYRYGLNNGMLKYSQLDQGKISSYKIRLSVTL